VKRAAARKPAPDTRGRIEEAAIRLFAARGYNGTSTRDIAGAVGVTEGALYRHFPSKDAIAREVFLKRYRTIAEGIAAVRARETAFDACLRSLVTFLFEIMAEDPAGFTFVLLTQHSHLQYVPDDPDTNVVEAIVRILDDAMDAGEIRRGDPQLAAAMALGMVLQPAIFHLYGRLPRPDEATIEAIVTSMLRALR
jgi:AcrR family transcriptional regulator